MKHAILTSKSSGEMVVFTTVDTEREAESIARNLRAFVPTPVLVVTVSDKPIRPGSTYKPRKVRK